MSNLCEKGLINYAPYAPITLTAEGEKEAKKILQRHEVMSVFLKNILHLSEDESTLNACRMEHIMTEEMFQESNLFLHLYRTIAVKTKTLAVRLKTCTNKFSQPVLAILSY